MIDHIFIWLSVLATIAGTVSVITFIRLAMKVRRSVKTKNMMFVVSNPPYGTVVSFRVSVLELESLRVESTRFNGQPGVQKYGEVCHA